MVPQDSLDTGRPLPGDCGRDPGAAGRGGSRRRRRPLLRPRHDRRHERAHHGRHGGHRTHHDRGVSRHPGDPPPAPAPQLRHPDPEAPAAGAAPPAARDPGTDLSPRTVRHAARARRARRDPRRLSGRRRGGGGHQLPAQLSQSRPRGGGRGGGARAPAGRLRLCVARGRGRAPGARTDHDDGAERLARSGREPLPRAPWRTHAGDGHRGPEDPSVPRRRRLARGSGRDGGPLPDVGAGGGSHRGRLSRRPGRVSGRHHLRRGGNEHRRVPAREPPATRRQGARAPGAPRPVPDGRRAFGGRRRGQHRTRGLRRLRARGSAARRRQSGPRLLRPGGNRTHRDRRQRRARAPFRRHPAWRPHDPATRSRPPRDRRPGGGPDGARG